MASPSSPSADTVAYVGARDPASENSDYAAQVFLVRQVLARIATATLVQVKAVTLPGPTYAVGTVNVQPMVHQIDGIGRPTPHGIIYNVPYFRLQGGANAIVLDPAVNDIGIAVFASRDISAVKNTRKVNVPGSRRRYDWADALYIGGVLNGVPTQLVAFTAAGIQITSPVAVAITAPNITLDTAGNLAVTGGVIAGHGGADQVGLQTHTHGPDSHGDTIPAPTAGS